MEPWWTKYPDRLNLELEAFTAHGMSATIDEAARSKGRLILYVTGVLDSTSVSLRVSYPETYPHFSPEVASPQPIFGRHQNPNGGQLCLLSEGGSAWLPAKDRAADLIAAQFRLIARAAADPSGDDAAEIESHQGEPFTIYLQYEVNSHVGLPPISLAGSALKGSAELSVFQIAPMRAIVRSVRGDDGSLIGQVDGGLGRLSERGNKVTIPWVHLPTRPISTTAEDLYDEVRRSHPDVKHAWIAAPPKARDTEGEFIKYEVLLVSFEDELTWRDFGENAIVLIRRQYANSLSNGKRIRCLFARAEFESSNLLRLRVPELKPLADKKVAVIGLGSLGSSAAVELARAGIGRMAVMDGDLVEAGNAVRWMSGRSYAGVSKALALTNYVSANYPNTIIDFAAHHRIGGILPTPTGRNPAGESEAAMIEKMLDGASLIFDASASITVNNFLSGEAARLGIPYIWISATQGAWGGMVGRVDAVQQRGCWMCHLHHLGPNTIPLPATQPGDERAQPPGCSEPTFTGSHVDLSEVTLMGVRLALATLCRGTPSAYPDYPWDLAICDLRLPDGRLIPPTWRTYSIAPHPDCCGHEDLA